MNELIPDPARGGDILPWARGVTDVCRRFGAIGSGNLLVREGPGGIGYESLPENRRGRTAAVIHGCFEITTYTPSIGSDPYPAIVNRYFRVGHLIREMEAASPPSVESVADADHPILALVVTSDYQAPEVSLEKYEDFDAIKTASEDESKAIYPLYLFRFDSEGNYAGVEIDFRNIPNIDITED